MNLASLDRLAGDCFICVASDRGNIWSATDVPPRPSQVVLAFDDDLTPKNSIHDRRPRAKGTLRNLLGHAIKRAVEHLALSNRHASLQGSYANGRIAVCF